MEDFEVRVLYSIVVLISSPRFYREKEEYILILWIDELDIKYSGSADIPVYYSSSFSIHTEYILSCSAHIIQILYSTALEIQNLGGFTDHTMTSRHVVSLFNMFYSLFRIRIRIDPH